MWKTLPPRVTIRSMTAGADIARLRAIVLAGAGTSALALSVSGLALSGQGLDLAPGFPAWLALLGFAGLVAMAAATWVVLAERPGVATGLSVSLVGLAVPSWAAWDWMPVAMLPILHAAAPFAVAGAAHVGLGWSRRAGRRRILAPVYVLAAAGSVLTMVGYDPFADPGCAFTCADADPIAGSLVTTRFTVTAAAALLSAAAAASAWSIARQRRDPLAVRLGTLVAVALLVAGWDARALWWADGVPPLTLVASRAVAALLIAAAVLVSVWLVRRNRIAAERLIVELNAAHPSAGPMQIGHAVAFSMPDEIRWVDAEGRTVPAEMIREGAVALSVDGGSTVRVWLDHGASAPTFDAISPAARVALANARLSAVIKARLADLQGSRRRIVRASHAERHRIGRDLHDGAQQRLIAASLHLRVAENHLPSAVAWEQARTAIGEALERLRGLAQGLLPSGLPTENLRTILRDLVDESSVNADLEMPDVEVDDDVAIALHAAVRSVLAHAGMVQARDVRVEVVQPDAERIGLRIEVRGSAGLDDWEATAVADHIGAVGGSTSVSGSPEHLLLIAELPCVS